MANKGEVSILVKIKEEGAKALSSVADKLEDMKGKAAAFGVAVTGALGFAVKQYADQEAAVNKLEAALKTQGLEVGKLSVTYQKLADDLQKTTLFGDEQILSAIALGQSFAGNIPITQELTESVADFAAATGTDLESAFGIVGKSIGTNTNALARYGVELEEGATASEKMQAITEALAKKFDGAAEAQTKGLGSVQQLKKAMGELFESIGKELAPAVTSLAKNLTEFVNALNTEPFAKVAAVVGVLAAGIAGLVATLGTIITVMPGIIAALGLLASPITLIAGAVVALGAAWATNFLGIQDVTNGVLTAIRAAITGFVEEVSGIFSDFGGLLKSVFTFDVSGIKTSFDSLKARLTGIVRDTGQAFKTASIEGANQRKELNKEVIKEEIDLATLSAKQIEQARLDVSARVHEEEVKNQEKNLEDAQKAAKEQERLDLDLAKHKREADKESADKSKEKWQEVAGHVEAFTSKGLQGAVSSGLEALTNTFLPGFGGAAGAVFDLLSKDSEEFTKIISQLFSAEFLGNVMKNIVILFEELPEILSGIIDFVVENMPALAEKLIAAIIGNLPEIMSALAKMFSDPKFIADLAAAIAKGFAAGIKDAVGDITEAIKKAFKDAAGALGDIFDFGGGGGGGGFLGGLFNQGGTIPHLAHGGYVKGYAGGGIIDNTLAALTPGEFVVNRASAQANNGALQAINNSNGRAVNGGGNTINITVNGGLLGDEASARELARAIDEQLYKLRLGRESRSFDTGL